MILHLPADLELTFPVREFIKRVGLVPAIYCLHRLFFDLAFQARTHDRCGFYLAEHVGYLKASLAAAGDAEELFKGLLESRILERRDCHFFCPIFFHFNPHLDRTYAPPEYGWIRDWRRWVDRLARHDRVLLKEVAALAWCLPDGTGVTSDDMTRAVVLVQTLDMIFHGSSRMDKGIRTPSEFGIGLLQKAVGIVRTMSNLKLTTVLRRLLLLSRPRRNPDLPPTTEDCLKHWDDVVAYATPTEGFEEWERRVASKALHPEAHADELRTEQIEEELNYLIRGKYATPTPKATETPPEEPVD